MVGGGDDSNEVHFFRLGCWIRDPHSRLDLKEGLKEVVAGRRWREVEEEGEGGEREERREFLKNYYYDYFIKIYFKKCHISTSIK